MHMCVFVRQPTNHRLGLQRLIAPVLPLGHRVHGFYAVLAREDHVHLERLNFQVRVHADPGSELAEHRREHRGAPG